MRGKDITWKVYPAGELGLAIDKGEVDAVANAEPIGSLLIAEGKVRNIADQNNGCALQGRVLLRGYRERQMGGC